MNRSALLLLAKAARASRATVSSPPRVSSTRMPRRASMAALSWRAIDSTTFFSRVPDGPRAPFSVPPCPGSITIVRTPVDSGSERRCHRAVAWLAPGSGRRPARSAPRRPAPAAPQDVDRQAQLGRPRAARRRGSWQTARPSASSTVDGRHDAAGGQQRRGTDAAREVGVQGVSGEADQQAAVLVDDRLRHGRRDHERDARAVGQRLGSGPSPPAR